MLKLEKINKSYKTGEFVQHALKDINLEFRKKEFVSILGASGSGKTTLLNIIGGLDRYDSGDLIINETSTTKFKDKDWDAYRNNCIGFIFQSYNLITHISILENVEMGMTLGGVSAKKRRKKAKDALKKVGLEKHINKKPNQLSGGQMQRVAIARALVNDPEIILADEPTGALDSETSVQIMELIKEIASDKLVIMVTHNPELAKKYSTRVIEFKDGKLISDSNPIDKKDETNEEYKINKTSMGFLTALKLSFNNIVTKKGRTLLTAFAASIGIIGIALILSLSNGFDKKIDEFEVNTLSQMPIVISPTVMISDEKAQEELKNMMTSSDNSYTDKKEIYPLLTLESITHKNKITTDYIKYIEKIDNSYIGGIAYNRATNLNILYKTNGKITYINSSSIMAPLPENTDGKEDSIITNNFEVIYGKMSQEKNELLLLVDSKNRVSLDILKLLGYSENQTVTFDELLEKEFKVVFNDDFYKSYGENFIMNTSYDELYNNENNLTLRISGIIRGKKNSTFAEYSGTGLIYKESLMEYVMEKNDSSKIVKKQKEADYNVLTGEKFTGDTESSKNEILGYFGAISSPIAIQIYPKDFKSKDKLLEYLDKYNENKSEEEKILYTDYAKAISSLSSGIMDAITIVLIAFSAISLVVSSIMIGIITYISVLERTKEIGILRALGARKKDIKRVFNAETFIIGLTSGLIGILIARLLLFPANAIIENLTNLAGVAQMNPVHAIILIIISILLTVIGGAIPAGIASKKDPVESLRTE